MPSKNEIILAVIGLAVVGFIVYYFFYSKKPTPSSSSTSPYTTLTNDVGGFVNDVKSAFSKVLSAGGNIMSGVEKDVGWGEKELGNPVGMISTGASRFGRTVVSDTEHFVRGVEHVFGDVGKTLSSRVSTITKNLESVGAKTEKTVENIPSGLAKIFYPPANIFIKDIKGFEYGVSQAPKEIMKEAKTVGSDVEKGVNGFDNDVKSFLLRL